MAIVKKSQTQLDLEQVWRTAFRTEGGLEIPCRTRSDAVRFRQTLYNAVKWVKVPKDGQIVDEQLQEAVAECVLSLVGEGQATVHVRRKQDDPVMQEVRRLIGGPAEDTIAHVAKESAARVQALLAAETSAEPKEQQPLSDVQKRTNSYLYGSEEPPAFDRTRGGGNAE
jgi:hypothetical protein